MDIPLFYLQTVIIGLLLSDDKGYGIWDKISCADRYGTADFLQGIKVEEAQLPPLYDPELGRIEAAVIYDSDKLIVDGMEEHYDFIPAHQIRELILPCDREDDASRATFIHWTDVAVPLRIL